MIPASTVEECALEGVEALDVGELGVMEDARRGNDEVAFVAGAIAQLELPTSVFEGRAGDLPSVHDLVGDAETIGHALEVRLDLRAR